MKANNLGKRIIVIGDVHGEYEKFRTILSDAKLVDSSINWIGSDTILVQTGDMIDRGPKSIESVGLIRSLQEQAHRVGGTVVRLLGNHELELLKERCLDPNLPSQNQLSEVIRKEIVQGKVCAAWTDV